MKTIMTGVEDKIRRLKSGEFSKLDLLRPVKSASLGRVRVLVSGVLNGN
jgi:hypothetical protein